MIAGAKQLQTRKHAAKVSPIVLQLQRKCDCKRWQPTAYAHAHYSKQVPKQMQILQNLLLKCRWDKAFEHSAQVQPKCKHDCKASSYDNANANTSSMQVQIQAQHKCKRNGNNMQRYANTHTPNANTSAYTSATEETIRRCKC